MLSLTNKKNYLRIILNTPSYLELWPRGYKTFFVLNSTEHEILNAHQYKDIKKFGLF